MNQNIKFTLLGTGTSSGVPTISCKCDTCTSADPKDKRLRCSLLIQSETTNIVIDTSADFRQQMLKYQVDKLDAVVYTHQHFDHISGFDDIRAYNFTSGKPMNIYLNDKTYNAMKNTFAYAFGKAEQIGGGIPNFIIHKIDEGKFQIGDIEFEIIPMLHGKLPVLGFRIGSFAYCTDTNYISESSIELLQDLDILILDALRYKKHPTHFNVEEALEMTEKINPKQTYFTHISHNIKYSDLDPKLPRSVHLAYDGLSFKM